MFDALPPPNDERAERVVLCGLLRDDTYGDGLKLARRGVERAGLRRDDLYWHRHLLVWDSHRGLTAVGTPATAWEVWRQLGRAGHWREWAGCEGWRDGRHGCAAWLLGVLDEDPTGLLAEQNAVVVRRLALLRGKLARARELATEVWNEARTIGQLGALAVK